MKLIAIAATIGLTTMAHASINSSYFESLDVELLHQEEIQNEKKGEAPRFAIPKKMNVGLATHPNWEKSGEGYTWTYQVTAPNAVSLNFAFGDFFLPEGSELNIYSADRSQFIRTFTATDNNVHQELWSPVIMSDDVVIELFVPAAKISEAKLTLTQVGQGFRTFAETTNKSGACNVDVSCKESKGWEKEVNTVAVISTGGSRFCTGFMVNNTSNDKTPFFMTAAHCRINERNAASLVTYWNYQTSSCKGSRDGKLTDFQTGAVHLASYTPSDFTLVKLLTSPKDSWNVNFAGWDATEKVGSPAVAIHHPNTDEKSISFENDPTTLSSYSGSSSPGDGTHVRVADWDVGTTEPGSSGSPLFDLNHRVIGQLHGGGAACGNDLPDYYGRFNTSWKGNGSSKGTRLSDHLDSAGTGRLTTDTI